MRMEQEQRYRKYLEQSAITDAQRELYEKTSFESPPLFSLLCADEDPSFLKASLQTQIYPHFELLLGRDPKALARKARGDFLLYFPRDGILSSDALYQMALLLAADADAVYGDYDRLCKGRRVSPQFLPAYSPDTLLSYPYIGVPFAVKRSLDNAVGGLVSFDAGERRRYTLLVTREAKRVLHVPRVLFSDSGMDAPYGTEPVRKALRSFHERGLVTEGLFLGSTAIRFGLRGRPLVSVIIAGKGDYKSLRQSLEAIDTSSLYRRIEYVVSESAEDETLHRYLENLQKKRLARVLIPQSGEPNAAQALNTAAFAAKGRYLLFLNAGDEPISGDFAERLCELAARNGTGAVGGSVVNTDKRIVSCGTVVGLLGGLGSLYAEAVRDEGGTETTQIFDRSLFQQFTRCIRNVSALPLCGLTLARELFFAQRGFDETLGTAGFAEELCLRLNAVGRRTIFTPYATFLTRSLPQKANDPRMQDVFRAMLKEGDPYFSPNFSLETTTPQIKTRERSGLSLHVEGEWFTTLQGSAEKP